MAEFKVSGTYVWYYVICKREVWLMSRAINPDQDYQSIDIGRFIHENSYSRESKEIEYNGMKFDIMKNKGGNIVIGEIKKSSRSLESAKMQLLFYLYELEKEGVKASGQLLIPEEKLKIELNLDDESRAKILSVINEIMILVNFSSPPHPTKCTYCHSCAYAELCWA